MRDLQAEKKYTSVGAIGYVLGLAMADTGSIRTH